MNLLYVFFVDSAALLFAALEGLQVVMAHFIFNAMVLLSDSSNWPFVYTASSSQAC